MLYDSLTGLTDRLLAAPERAARDTIGHSRQGRPLLAERRGTGALQVSLIGGCHADEPVGPRLLGKLISLLDTLEPEHPALAQVSWHLLPWANPDGQWANAAWQTPDAAAYDLARYLATQRREPPGEDLEFGFPRDADDVDARPEARAITAWWRETGQPFHLHGSLHGMSFGPGPWYLLEASWADRMEPLRQRCVRAATRLGYPLNPIDRKGEKGFTKLAEGFSTRPDSVAMREHFLALGDAATAGRFRPSSMETVRSLGGDPLTIVTEMPLFIVPLCQDCLAPAWRDGLRDGSVDPTQYRPMPVAHQMRLIWDYIAAAADLVATQAQD